MRKLLLTFALIGGVVCMSNAQEIANNAIGLRLGGGNGFGAEVSYQRAIGTANNRLEFDLGLEDDGPYDAFKLIGLYQWVWAIQDGFNWYAGPGAGIGFYDYYEEDGAYGVITGTVGLEYSFDFPLLLSVDFRPEFLLGVTDHVDDVNFGVGLSARYQF